jgi:hypothetical protein
MTNPDQPRRRSSLDELNDHRAPGIPTTPNNHAGAVFSAPQSTLAETDYRDPPNAPPGGRPPRRGG